MKDIEYDQNNGTIAVRPVPDGKLDRLVRWMQGEEQDEQRLWVFGDAMVYRDGRFEYIEHIRHGVMCGTYAEGRGFLEMCRVVGLRVERGAFFVPFSNGQRRHGSFRDGAPCADYHAVELRLARWDLPTEAELREILADALAAQPPA